MERCQIQDTALQRNDYEYEYYYTTKRPHSFTHSLTYLWTSWFLLNWRMTWCGLFVLVGNILVLASSRYRWNIPTTNLWLVCCGRFVHGRLLLLWTVHSVLLSARLNEKWDERSLFRGFTLYMFPTRTCRDSSIWFRFASYRFRIPTDVDHLRRRGRRRCVYGIYGTGSGAVQILF